MIRIELVVAFSCTCRLAVALVLQLPVYLLEKDMKMKLGTSLSFLFVSCLD